MRLTSDLLILMRRAITALGYPCVYNRANQRTKSPYVLLTVVNDEPLNTTPASGSSPTAPGEFTDVDIAVCGLGTNSAVLMAIREACVTAVNSISGSLGCQARPPGMEDDENGRIWYIEYATMRYLRR